MLGNVLITHDLRLTVGKYSDINARVVVTAAVRFRRKLEELVRRRGAKAGLASYCKHSASWVSNLLAPRAADPQVTLSDLDNIAGYFRISIGELLGAPKPGELSGDEQRMVHAFRALPAATQDHLLSLIDAASLGSALVKNRGRLPLRADELARNVGRPHESVAVSDAWDETSELAALRAYLARLSADLAAAATGAIPDRSTPGARPGQTGSRGVGA